MFGLATNGSELRISNTRKDGMRGRGTLTNEKADSTFYLGTQA